MCLIDSSDSLLDAYNFWAIEFLEKLGYKNPTENQISLMESIIKRIQYSSLHHPALNKYTRFITDHPCSAHCQCQPSKPNYKLRRGYACS